MYRTALNTSQVINRILCGRCYNYLYRGGYGGLGRLIKFPRNTKLVRGKVGIGTQSGSGV